MANHREEFLYLAGLTHKAALIAWGAFFFKDDDLLDDDNIKKVDPHRKQSIGASSEPYGEAVVRVFEVGEADPVAQESTATANHVWINGLSPDTVYRYEVEVNGAAWAGGPRRDWDGETRRLGEQKNTYTNEFRTYPAPDAVAETLTFAVIGDYGRGVRKKSDPGAELCQDRIAEALGVAVDTFDVRFLLSTGDNIYAQKTILGIPIGGTGDEDDDWYFTFYQPYRYVINRIPVYTVIGNHDDNESEDADDRKQVIDNFYLRERFLADGADGTGVMLKGLFYWFRFGRDIEFVALDTSSGHKWSVGSRYFELPENQAFLQASFPNGGDGPRWRIPFFHHPPYSAGPRHKGDPLVRERLAGSLFRNSNVRAAFAGHEHNFQLAYVDKIHYFVSGGAGKIRPQVPGSQDFKQEHINVYSAAPHFLVVTIAGDIMGVMPFGELEGEALHRIPLSGLAPIEGAWPELPFKVKA